MEGGAGTRSRPATNNFTFTDDRLLEIGKGNLRLMQHLGKVTSVVGAAVIAAPVPGPAVREASAAINRRKQKTAIKKENEVRGSLCVGVRGCACDAGGAGHGCRLVCDQITVVIL